MLNGETLSLTLLLMVLWMLYMELRQSVLQFGPGGVAVFLVCEIPLYVLFVMWWRLGDTVQPGFIVSMYLHSTVLGLALSILFEVALLTLWTYSFPGCNLGLSPIKGISPLTDLCEAESLLQWFSVPAMVEETFKSVWIFYRLRRRVEDIPKTCGGDAWDSTSYWSECGWWFRLAPTPQHVLLAAVAAGAGFEAGENLGYVLQYKNSMMALRGATLRAISPLHICWTGMVGVGLARRLFLPRDQSPSLLGVVGPVALLNT